MKLALITLATGFAVVLGFLAYVRLAPSDPAVWHVDPRLVTNLPDTGRYMRRDAEGDGPAAVFPGPQDAVLGRFDAIAMAEPGVSLLAGSVADHHVTYIARSRIIGFPDYISVVAYPAKGGTVLAIYSRLRFGQSDFGVNARRIEGWLRQMS